LGEEEGNAMKMRGSFAFVEEHGKQGQEQIKGLERVNEAAS
jgi:hypothetical protein